MFSAQTIYTTDPDLSTLSAIFNGVAMICNQQGIIWGCAVAAAMWKLFTLSTSAAFQAATGGASSPGKEWPAFIVPFLLAGMLTNGDVKTDVHIESTVSGNVKIVSNVPVILSVVQSTFTGLGQDVGRLVETAYQGVGTDYSAISASGTGFINPLKVLLTSRTAIMKLGGINSQVNSVISACLGSDSGVNYATINSLVSLAGNGGATAAQSLSVYDAAGDSPTSVGALLYQASLNLTGKVPDIDVNGNHLVSCFDAANKVAENINTALYSTDFTRVVQGAVNSSDQPNSSAGFDIGSLSREYLAVRTANTVTNTLVGGAAQANAELVNLMFSELVRADLNCLKADGQYKITCLATATQANEIERNNIQLAANANEGLMYMGHFANAILCFIIALGPILVMCMMFVGLNVNKTFLAAVHMIVWPILAMHVGAEIINGMIYTQIASFMHSISQGGYIAHAQMMEVYKEFSMKIGTASQMMSQLPILMTTIFGLSAGAAMVRISDSLGTNNKKVGEVATPTAIDSVPLIRQGSAFQAQHGLNSSTITPAGSLSAAAIRSTMGGTEVTAAQAIQDSNAQIRTLSEGRNQLESWENAFRTGDYKSVGVSKSVFDSVKSAYDKQLSSSQNQSNKTGKSDTDGTSKTQTAEVHAGVEGSISANPLKWGIEGKAGASVSAATQGSQNQTDYKATEEEKSRALRLATSTVHDNGSTVTGHNSIDHKSEKTLSHVTSTQASYSDTLSHVHSTTESADTAIRKSASFVANTQNITAAQVANQAETNADFQRFMVGAQSRAFSTDPAAEKYLARARAESGNGSIDHINGRGQSALENIRAATLMAGDTNASAQHRLKATEFLTGAVKAMEGYGIDMNALDNVRPVGDPSAPSRPHLPGGSTPNAKGSNAVRSPDKTSHRQGSVMEPGQPPRISDAPGGSATDSEVKSSARTSNAPRDGAVNTKISNPVRSPDKTIQRSGKVAEPGQPPKIPAVPGGAAIDSEVKSSLETSNTPGKPTRR